MSLLSTSLQEPKPVEVIPLSVAGLPLVIPTGISDKGDVAVGYAVPANNATAQIAWVWTKQKGMTTLNEKPGMAMNWTVTGDGRFFAGSIFNRPNGPWIYYGLSSNPNSRAMIGDDFIGGGGSTWSTSLRFSNDGRYLIDHNWKRQDVFQIHDIKTHTNTLLPVAVPGVYGTLIGISADGSRVMFQHGHHLRHYLWDRSKPTVLRQIRIPGLEGNRDYEIRCLSDDGKYGAGYWRSGKNRTAFRWSEDKGFEPGPENPTIYPFDARVINGDGSIVVGLGGGEDKFNQVCIWKTNAGTMRSLKSLLKPDELPHPKIVFNSISDVSPDGTVYLVAGNTIEPGNKMGPNQVYIVKFASKKVFEER